MRCGASRPVCVLCARVLESAYVPWYDLLRGVAAEQRGVLISRRRPPYACLQLRRGVSCEVCGDPDERKRSGLSAVHLVPCGVHVHLLKDHAVRFYTIFLSPLRVSLASMPTGVGLHRAFYCFHVSHVLTEHCTRSGYAMAASPCGMGVRPASPHPPYQRNCTT